MLVSMAAAVDSSDVLLSVPRDAEENSVGTGAMVMTRARWVAAVLLPRLRKHAVCAHTYSCSKLVMSVVLAASRRGMHHYCQILVSCQSFAHLQLPQLPRTPVLRWLLLLAMALLQQLLLLLVRAQPCHTQLLATYWCLLQQPLAPIHTFQPHDSAESCFCRMEMAACTGGKCGMRYCLHYRTLAQLGQTALFFCSLLRIDEVSTATVAREALQTTCTCWQQQKQYQSCRVALVSTKVPDA